MSFVNCPYYEDTDRRVVFISDSERNDILVEGSARASKRAGHSSTDAKLA